MTINLNGSTPNLLDPAHCRISEAKSNMNSMQNTDNLTAASPATTPAATLAPVIASEPCQADAADLDGSQGLDVVDLVGGNATEKDIEAVKVNSSAVSNDTRGGGQVAAVGPSLPVPDLKEPQVIAKAPVQVEGPVPSSMTPLMAHLGLLDLSHAEQTQLESELSVARRQKLLSEQRALFKALTSGLVNLGVVSADKEAETSTLLLRALAATSVKTQVDAKHKPSIDKTGQGPAVGVPYRHPITGQPWTKTRAQGVAKKPFITLIQAGATWADLVDRGQAPQQS